MDTKNRVTHEVIVYATYRLGAHIEVAHDQSGEVTGWFARVVELPGCMTQADTFDELGEAVQDAIRAWLLTAFEAEMPIPEPDSVAEHTGQPHVFKGPSTSGEPAISPSIRRQVARHHHLRDLPLPVATGRGANRRLDEAVFAAYGWPPDLSDEEVLTRRLALNLERAVRE